MKYIKNVELQDDRIIDSMSENKLKPCPFCGGEAKIHIRTNKELKFPTCANTSCIGHQMTHWFFKEKDAIEAWNRRAKS